MINLKPVFAFYDRAWEGLAALWLQVLFMGTDVQGGLSARAVGKLPIINNKGRMTLGAGVVLRSQAISVVLASDENAHLKLGNRVFVNSGTIIRATKDITIGNDCRIGEMCAIYDTNFHALSDKDPVKVAPVTLGKNVWLGRGVMVLPGVTIGDHSVIGAGSLVRSDIPPKSVAIGNPAVVVRAIDCADDFIRA